MTRAAARHFYGATLIGLGAWEALGYAHRVPTITAYCERRKRMRVLLFAWMAGAVHHILKGES